MSLTPPAAEMFAGVGDAAALLGRHGGGYQPPFDSGTPPKAGDEVIARALEHDQQRP